MTDIVSVESGGLAEDAVTTWLTDHIEGLSAPFTFRLIAGGHSCLTYGVTDTAGRRVVLRRPPLGQVLSSAHDVVREHRIIAALAPTPVPVPRVLGVCEDVSVNGAAFFVMEHVDGVVLHDAAVVDGAFPRMSARSTIGISLVDALAELHLVDLEAVGLTDLSRHGGYLDRQLKRWLRQWEASRTRELPDMEHLHQWLVDHRPPETRTSIVHGDFRLGNVLLQPDGRVAALLDWELCTLGDPAADVAYLLRSWVQPGEPVGSHLVPPTVIGGFPSREHLVERYVERTGHELADLDYWAAFIAWRSAAIAEGVLRRYLEGSAASAPDDLDVFRRMVEQSLASGIAAARQHAG